MCLFSLETDGLGTSPQGHTPEAALQIATKIATWEAGGHTLPCNFAENGVPRSDPTGFKPSKHY